eukprot:CAMPEP_0181372366 /NCGR_PEP_ID=MMETSP1106-20121128/14679_1 /TAXON_ID=81844 /ORGANISM="Mantoniella antarctica, Strain SL-175" /LENGTH=112 /DNA_ID=CAMNT_0023489737 /DNA_START=43 /DNA_END=381 /DNA_ORIENTATION=-
MAAFLAGTPVMAKATVKPVVARRNTTVRAAAAPESVNRRAAVAGILALFAAAPASAEPREKGKVRKKEKKVTTAYSGNSSGGLGKFKPSRNTVQVQTADIKKYYGIDKLPGQ